MKRVEYGWIIVATLCVTETVSWGIVYYGFPVFLQAMERDLAVSRLAVTGALSVALAISALAALPVGRWIDRRGARGLMTAGSCLAFVLLIAWSRVHSLVALYAVWSAMGVAMAMILYQPAFAAIVQWFPLNRERALLTVTLAAGFASTIFMPTAAWLLAWIGWRRAITALATFLAAVTIPAHALILRAPDGLGRGAQPGGHISTDATLGTALRHGVFWVLALAFAFGNFTVVSLNIHMIPYLGQHGYSTRLAASIVGWIGGMQVPGRLLFVPITAWLGAAWVTGSLFFAEAAAMALLAAGALGAGLAPMILLFGAAAGMLTLAQATAVADIWGRRHYASIAGAMAIPGNLARALGPVGSTLVYAWLGGYSRVFWLLAVALAVTGVTVLITEHRAAPRTAAPGRGAASVLNG
ncbi:MAG TPA: MFS transporter [bacterium]|nr:MFS transporter [bacterium]